MITVNKILNFAVHCFQLYQSLVLLFIFPLSMSFSTYLYSFTFFLCLFVHSGGQHILRCVFVLFVFVLCLVYPMLPVSLGCPFLIAPLVFPNVYLSCVLCTLCCQFLWVVHFWLTLGVSLTFIVSDIIPNLKLQTGKVCALLQNIYLAICMLYLRII